jgi:hypothetical protein
MSQSFRNLLAIVMASGTVLVVSPGQAQVFPELDSNLEQSSVHSVLATEEASLSNSIDREPVVISEAASNAAIATPAENLENSNPRIPISSRIFPSMQQ